MEASRSVAEILSFPSWASMRKFWRWHRSGGSCARLSRSCGVLRAVSPGVGRIRVHPPRLPRGLVGFPLPSRRAAERGAAPRRAPDVGGSLGRAHGREGRGVGRTRGAACFRSGDRFQPFLGISCPGSGPDREMRGCGPLRACNGSAMAGSGPEMSPPRHPPSAGPDRSRPLQPLGERVNRTCGQSRGTPCAPQLEAGQPPGLAVLTIQGARRSLHAGLLPLPTQALDRPDPPLGPEAECVPTHPNFVRRKAGQDGPRLLLLGVPDRRQGVTAFCGGCAESGPAPDSRGIRTGKEGAGGQPPPARGAESDVFRIPMWGYQPPGRGRGQALSQDLSPQFRTGQGLQQFHYRVHPSPALSKLSDQFQSIHTSVSPTGMSSYGVT